MKPLLTTVILLLTGISIFAQSDFTSNYDRSSITTVFINRNQNSYDKLFSNAAEQCIVYDKFDDHNLEIRSLNTDLPRVLAAYNGTNENNSDQRLGRVINEFKIPNLMILKWWDVREDGSYSTQLIEQRGIYNATDAEVRVAEASKRGKAMLKDNGEKLIGNSYIVVVDFVKVQTMTEIYDAQDAAAKLRAEKNDTKFVPVTRNKTGFKAEALTSIFKINWNDTLNYEIWEAPYYDEANDRFNIDAFLNKQMPISFLARFKVSSDGSQYKDANRNPGNKILSNEELFIQMYNEAVTNTLIAAPNQLEAFRVKTGLVSKKPLAAKIGKKEGLSVEQRYFVWENKMKNNGDIKQIRKGVIRVKNVADNRSTALGKTPTSEFYQTAGKSLAEGMLLQQNPDYGIGVSLGSMSGTFGGFNLRAEINASMYAGYTSDAIPTGIKLYGFLSFDSGEYPTSFVYNNFGTSDISFFRYGAGLEKEWVLGRNVQFIPFLGIGGESASSTESGSLESFDTYLMDYGLRFGFNLRYNIQLMYSINYITPIGYASVKYEDTEAEVTAYKWLDFFEDRSGRSNEISIRFLF